MRRAKLRRQIAMLRGERDPGRCRSSEKGGEDFRSRWRWSLRLTFLAMLVSLSPADVAAQGVLLVEGSSSTFAAIYATHGDYAVMGVESGGASYGWLGPAAVAGSSPGGLAVYGQTDFGTGVLGEGSYGEGVHGDSSYAYGVHGYSWKSDGLFGEASADNKSGIYAVNYSAKGYAGYFTGRVHVNGALSKASGSFKIDHPLDPENRYLYHSFVESPDMMNVYNGNVLLDERGEAWVELPEWFEALNRDFRYQLTCIGGFAPVYIAEKIIGNRFMVAGGTSGIEVSWQVTGIRQDPWAEAHRVQVEEAKSDQERGTYLHPVEWGKSSRDDVEWIHHPDVMERHPNYRTQPPDRPTDSYVPQTQRRHDLPSR